MAIGCGQGGAGTDRGDKSSDQFAWSAKVIALTEVGLLSHLLALIAYVGLFFAALSKQRRGINLWLAGAALVTALWAGSFAASMLIDPGLQPWISRLQTLKVGAWIGVLLYLLRPTWLGGEGEGRSSFWVGGILGFVLALQFVIDIAGAGQSALVGEGDVVASLFLVIRIAASVTGLVLSHNLYIASRGGQLSGIRLLAIGLAGLFLYDLNLYTLAFLLPPASVDLYNIRGAVSALLVLLFLFATRENWVRGARVSRNLPDRRLLRRWFLPDRHVAAGLRAETGGRQLGHAAAGQLPVCHHHACRRDPGVGSVPGLAAGGDRTQFLPLPL